MAQLLIGFIERINVFPTLNKNYLRRERLSDRKFRESLVTAFDGEKFHAAPRKKPASNLFLFFFLFFVPFRVILKRATAGKRKQREIISAAGCFLSLPGTGRGGADILRPKGDLPGPTRTLATGNPAEGTLCAARRPFGWGADSRGGPSAPRRSVTQQV